MSEIPLTFNDNNNLYEIIKHNYLEGSLSHSIIIHGEKGIGKSTFTRFLLFQIFNNFENTLQENIELNDLIIIKLNTHPNYILVDKEIDEKSKKLRNFIIIEQIRNLESFLYQTSIYDHLPKIVLIDNADQLNKNSSNALLKILEEPKKNTFFFLISHQLSNLLPTIRSRCIKFKFEKPTFENFSKIIIKNIENISDQDLNFLYDLSNGSPGLAQEYYTEEIRNIFDIIVKIFKEKKSISSEIINLSNNLGNQSNEQYNSFLFIIIFVLSNLIKIYNGVNIQNKFRSDIKSTLVDLTNYINLNKCIKTMDYIKEHQNDLFIFNLDKKIFTLNLFSEISNN